MAALPDGLWWRRSWFKGIELYSSEKIKCYNKLIWSDYWRPTQRKNYSSQTSICILQGSTLQCSTFIVSSGTFELRSCSSSCSDRSTSCSAVLHLLLVTFFFKNCFCFYYFFHNELHTDSEDSIEQPHHKPHRNINTWFKRHNDNSAMSPICVKCSLSHTNFFAFLHFLITSSGSMFFLTPLWCLLC